MSITFTHLICVAWLQARRAVIAADLSPAWIGWFLPGSLLRFSPQPRKSPPPPRWAARWWARLGGAVCPCLVWSGGGFTDQLQILASSSVSATSVKLLGYLPLLVTRDVFCTTCSQWKSKSHLTCSHVSADNCKSPVFFFFLHVIKITYWEEKAK